MRGRGERRDRGARGERKWRVVILVLVSACTAAPARNDAAPPSAIVVDPAPADLSQLKPNLPPPVSDTFVPLPRLTVESLPDAPRDLLDAAEREEGISRFCYQEYGQKVDPKLVGAVALVVTVEGNAIQSVRVGADDWSSRAGRAVNACLVQKAPQAWKILPGARVAPGRYVVQLRFRPS